MTNSQRLATVRAHLQRWLNENYAPSAQEDVAEPSLSEQSVGDPAADLGADVQPLAFPGQEDIGPESLQDAEDSRSELGDDAPTSAEAGLDAVQPVRTEFSVVGGEETPSEAASVIGTPDQASEPASEQADEPSTPESIPISVPIEEPVGPRIVNESILIRDGFYAGRTFHAVAGENRFKATWFMEPDELKIRDGVGEVLAVFHGEEIVVQEMPAADAPSHAEVAEDQNSEQGTVRMPLPEMETDRDIDGEDRVPKAA